MSDRQCAINYSVQTDTYAAYYMRRDLVHIRSLSALTWPGAESGATNGPVGSMILDVAEYLSFFIYGVYMDINR